MLLEKVYLYNNIYFQVRNYNNLAKLFDKTNQPDSCIYYACQFTRGCALNITSWILPTKPADLLTKTYESAGKPDSTLKYIKIMLAAKDSVFSQAKGQQFRQVNLMT